MSYEEAHADSWSALLAQEAHAFMVDLQAKLRFWEVAADGDPAFGTALRKVGADLAWAFEERDRKLMAPKPAADPNSVSGGSATPATARAAQSLRLAGLCLDQFDSLCKMSKEAEPLLDELSRRRLARRLGNVKAVFERHLKTHESLPLEESAQAETENGQAWTSVITAESWLVEQSIQQAVERVTRLEGDHVEKAAEEFLRQLFSKPAEDQPPEPATDAEDDEGMCA